LLGQGTYENASEWYERGINVDNPACQFAVGSALLTDEDEESMARGQALVRQSANSGYAPAIHEIATSSCFPESRSDFEVFSLCKKAADKGFLPAMFDLANCYRNGSGVAQSKNMALTLNVRAALRGHAPSMMACGDHYLNDRNNNMKDSAIVWYERAHRNRWHQAAPALLKCYTEDSCLKNPVLAFQWAFRLHLSSQFVPILASPPFSFSDDALSYLRRGIATSELNSHSTLEQAQTYLKTEHKPVIFRQLAKRGNHHAMMKCMALFPDRAASFLHMAADDGSEDACRQLSDAYANGLYGLTKNAVMAQEWKKKAVALVADDEEEDSELEEG
jgi:TPR repeat protein